MYNVGHILLMYNRYMTAFDKIKKRLYGLLIISHFRNTGIIAKVPTGNTNVVYSVW